MRGFFVLNYLPKTKKALTTEGFYYGTAGPLSDRRAGGAEPRGGCCHGLRYRTGANRHVRPSVHHELRPRGRAHHFAVQRN